MRTADVIRHAAVDDLGSFGPVLESRGYRVRRLEPFADDLSAVDARAADLAIVLGGAIGVNDVADYPFLNDEFRFVERRLVSGRPLVGVCLGAQIIAHVTGARVFKGDAVEVGYLPVTLTPEGEASCLAELAACDYRIMHWHADVFDLPAGAARLASTAPTPNQAFSLGPDVLGVQFHMEADPRTVGGWTVAYIGDIHRANMSLPHMRAEVARYGEAAAVGGARVLARWLDDLESRR